MGFSRRRLATLFSVSSLLVFGVDAAPAPQATTNAPVATGTVNPTACAAVASITDSLLAASPSATPTVPASVAIECLRSVPNKVEPAVKLIKSLKAFMQWQSTLAFLKDPPESYGFKPVDILGSLDTISAKAAAGGYANEFEFGIDIIYLISSAHDGHFFYRPDVMRAFGFRNQMALGLVSVSADGIEVPKIYHFEEVNSTRSTGALPRAISKINGEDAATVIERRNVVFSTYQDPDSQWNSVMRSYAFPNSINFVGGSFDYQGESLNIEYDNGETRTEDYFAIARPGANFSGVVTGEDFYARFCNPDTAPQAVIAASVTATATTSATTTAPTIQAEPTISGYPWPVVRDSGANVTSGYFLNGTGYDDVAVLAIPAFFPGDGIGFLEYMTDLQQVIEKFLAQSKEQNKKKLVIDLAANGGGFIVAGYELFNQLFPGIPLFRADNLRESESLRQMAVVSSRFLGEINGFDSSSLEGAEDAADNAEVARNIAIGALQDSAIIGNIVPGGVLAPDGSLLNSVDAILDPVIIKGDRFTAFQFTPLNGTSPGFNLSGTGHRSDLPPAVFAPENVVLLTDGTCGSTCTLFAYLMLQQLDVKATVVGGRPRTGAMQSIGGVEGSQVFQFADISGSASAVLTLDPSLNVTDSELSLLDEAYAVRRAMVPASAGGVNGKNAFMRATADTPLQFLFQPANCRFFYTKDMLFKPVEVWKRAVDATWTDPAKFCVEGSRMVMNLTQRQTDGKFFMNSQLNKDDGSGAVSGMVGGMRAVAVGLVVMVLAMWM